MRPLRSAELPFDYFLRFRERRDRSLLDRDDFEAAEECVVMRLVLRQDTGQTAGADPTASRVLRGVPVSRGDRLKHGDVTLVLIGDLLVEDGEGWHRRSVRVDFRVARHRPLQLNKLEELGGNPGSVVRGGSLRGPYRIEEGRG